MFETPGFTDLLSKGLEKISSETSRFPIGKVTFCLPCPTGKDPGKPFAD